MEIVAENKLIKITKLSLGPYGTNTYVVTCQETKDSAVVDAPGEPDRVIEALTGTKPRYILITHNHPDHIGALAHLKSTLNIPIAAHISDAEKLPIHPDILLSDNDVVDLGNVQLNVFHTPGHTPGSLCFYYDKFLISGDTCFPGGPGKTWSPAAFMQIISSLTNKIFQLPADTTVFPGHGGSTVVGKEKEEYRIFSSKPHDPDLCGDVTWLSS